MQTSAVCLLSWWHLIGDFLTLNFVSSLLIFLAVYHTKFLHSGWILVLFFLQLTVLIFYLCILSNTNSNTLLFSPVTTHMKLSWSLDICRYLSHVRYLNSQCFPPPLFLSTQANTNKSLWEFVYIFRLRCMDEHSDSSELSMKYGI